MDDNNVKKAVCPIRAFGPAEYNAPTNMGLYGPDAQSQSQNDGKNDFFGTKDPSTYTLPNLSMMMPKKYDESQDTQTQDDIASQDLHNGHNIQNDKVVQRTVTMSELEPVVDGEPDTVPIDEKVNDPVNDGGTQPKDCLEKPTTDNDNHEKMEVDFSSMTKNVPENTEKEKSQTDEESQSQDAFRTFMPEEKKTLLSKLEASETEENSMDIKHNEGMDTQSFDLHLSQTQSFMLPEKSQSPINCESDESKPSQENDKKVDADKIDGFDDRSNESGIKKLDSFDEQSNESGIKKVDSFDEQSNESGIKKVDSFDEQSNESEIKKVESCDERSNESQLKKVESFDERSNESEIKKIESSDESEVKQIDNSDDKSNDESLSKKFDSFDDRSNESAEKKVDSSDDKSVELMEVENPPVDIVKISSESEDTIEKLESPKKQVAFEEKVENIESDSGTSVSKSTSNAQVACYCVPACHDRIESISQHLNNACSQLEDFIKSKRRDDKKLLNNFLEMLKEIQCISENKEVIGETKISENVFSVEETTPKGGRKTATKRKSNDYETPLKATPRKKAAEEKAGKPSEKETIDFKDLKGLAVFAKWPNSGWYYPGIVEELTSADWKEVTNVTVKFYDGLVRDMKNINILPAYLIPAGSMLCDLEDETEMIVLSCEGSNQNSVDFKLSTKENPDTILELNFNKLAIKAIHMKTIKVQLEPTTDVTPKNMHVVSLVSGRRSSRGKSKKDEDAEEKTEEKPKVERRTATPKKAATPRRTRN